jgi:heme/copper-type cytochrome/quinol oxidase subunit 2
VSLLVFWSLVVWGSLLVLVTAWSALSEGLRPAVDRLLPAHGASLWAWLNALSAALALAVWLAVTLTFFWFRFRLRRVTSRDPAPPTGSDSR